MSNNERLKYSRFEGDFVIDNPDVEEKEQVTVTQSELKEIFQKLNLSGKQILNIDKKVFEKLEAYMEDVEKLKEYKRKIAREELEKYIVPTSKISSVDFYNVITYLNFKRIGWMEIYTHSEGSKNAYTVLSFREFKHIIAGTEYNYLSEAFTENGEDSEEKIFIDVYLWILEKGGRARIRQNFNSERELRIMLPKTK